IRSFTTHFTPTKKKKKLQIQVGDVVFKDNEIVLTSWSNNFLFLGFRILWMLRTRWGKSTVKRKSCISSATFTEKMEEACI
nr:hypothetical protein [Tanacetum cinerariifolium]